MSPVLYMGQIGRLSESGGRPLVTPTGRVRMLVNGGTGLATEKEEKRLMGAATQEQGPCLCRKIGPSAASGSLRLREAP